MDYGLFLRPFADSSIIIAYSGIGWSHYMDTCCLTTNYLLYFGPNLIAWRSKKQPMISEPSIDVKYCTVGYTVAQTIWFHKLLFDVGISFTTPTLLCCGNVSATHMTANPV